MDNTTRSALFCCPSCDVRFVCAAADNDDDDDDVVVVVVVVVGIVNHIDWKAFMTSCKSTM
jgi:hypothetical protein